MADRQDLTPQPPLRRGEGEKRRKLPAPPLGEGVGSEPSRARARAAAALREGLMLAAVLVVIAVVAGAFALPWLPRPAPGGDWIATYAPLRDGDAKLSLRTSGDGTPGGWMAQNSRLIPGLRLYTDLRKAIADALLGAAREPGEAEIPDGQLSDRLKGLTIAETRSYDLAMDGEVVESWQYFARTNQGDLFFGIHYPQTGNDVIFDPPAVVLPAEAEVGQTWHSEGKLGGGTYTWDGRFMSAGPYVGPAGQFEDCVLIESRFVIVTNNAPATVNPSHDWYCAEIGWVDGQIFAADGSLKQRTIWLGAAGALKADASLPPIQPADPGVSQEHEPAAPDRWRLARVGRVKATGETSEATVVPTWLPTDPPLLLAAGFGSDLVAYETFTLGAPPRWRFHTSGTVYGQPAYDPNTGRIYFGSSDKRLYAVDSRGLFLWSFETEDNVAARPLIVNGQPTGDRAAGDLVVAASEDGTVYALDAATGEQRWTFSAGDGIASWPALVGGTVVIGSDDKTVYGLDPASGEQRWTLQVGGAVEAPIVAEPDGSTVYVASRDGTLAAFQPSACTDFCSTIWEAKPGAALRSAPLLVEDRLILIDEDGQLLAARTEDGKRLWGIGTVRYVGAPILVQDAILVATSQGIVERISLEGQSLGRWDARSAANPADGEPSFLYGPVLGGDAVWITDHNAVVRRLGAPPLGEIPSLTMAWIDQMSRPPFTASQLRTSVAEHNGKAVVVDYTRGVFILDPATGAGSKLADLPGETLLAQVDPQVVGNTLLAVSGRTLQAMDLTNGQITWQGTAPGNTIRAPAVVGQTVYWVTGGDPNAVLLAVDLASGAMRWQASLGAVTQVGGVVASANGAYTSTPPAAWDIQTGTQRWRAPLAGVTVGGPALSPDGQTVYVAGIRPSNDGGMVAALDAATGEIRWQVDLNDGLISPLDRLWAVDDLLVVPDLVGKVIVLDATTGIERWRFKPPGGRLGNVTVARGQIWLMLENSRLYGLDLRNGKPTARLIDLEMSLNGNGLTQRPTFVGDRLLFPAGLILLGLNLPEPAP